MMSLSNCPARPTNGSPWRSSSAPGFAEKDQPGVRIAHAENGLRPRADQLGEARAGGHPLGHGRKGRHAVVGRRPGLSEMGDAGPLETFQSLRHRPSRVRHRRDARGLMIGLSHSFDCTSVAKTW